MNATQRNRQADLLEDRRMGARLLYILGQVIMGDDAQQREGVAMLIDAIKTDHFCARRMVRVFEGDKRMAQRFPELKEMAEQQVKGPLATRH